MRKKVVEIIQSSTKRAFNLRTYGSYANGLCLPSSDVDFLVEFNSHVDPKTVLGLMETGFKNEAHFKDIKFIKFAQIPVLKLNTDETYGNIQIDITVKESFHQGLNCVSIV